MFKLQQVIIFCHRAEIHELSSPHFFERVQLLAYLAPCRRSRRSVSVTRLPKLDIAPVLE
jgi:hypothetical protein